MRFLSNIKIPHFMVLTICALSIITSCKNTSEKELRETIEKTLDEPKVTVTTDDITDTQDWPSELPVFIPQYTYGTITTVNKQETEESFNWEIIFKNASEDTLKDYEKLLQDNGFNISTMTSVDIGLLLTADKDNTTIMVTTGYGSATVTIAIKK